MTMLKGRAPSVMFLYILFTKWITPSPMPTRLQFENLKAMQQPQSKWMYEDYTTRCYKSKEIQLLQLLK